MSLRQLYNILILYNNFWLPPILICCSYKLNTSSTLTCCVDKFSIMFISTALIHQYSGRVISYRPLCWKPFLPFPPCDCLRLKLTVVGETWENLWSSFQNSAPRSHCQYWWQKVNTQILSTNNRVCTFTYGLQAKNSIHLNSTAADTSSRTRSVPTYMLNCSLHTELCWRHCLGTSGLN